VRGVTALRETLVTLFAVSRIRLNLGLCCHNNSASVSIRICTYRGAQLYPSTLYDLALVTTAETRYVAAILCGWLSAISRHQVKGYSAESWVQKDRHCGHRYSGGIARIPTTMMSECPGNGDLAFWAQDPKGGA